MTRVSTEIIDIFLGEERHAEGSRELLLRYEAFRSNIHSWKTRRGIAVSQAYGFLHGRPREVDEEAIKRIMELHGQGLSIKRIADTLNAEGVPTPRSGKWHSPGVRRVIGWSEA